MSPLTPEEQARFSELQPMIWGHVGTHATQSTGYPLRFENPLTLSTNAEEINQEFVGAMLIAKFSLTGINNVPQLILVPSELALALLNRQLGSSSNELNDDLVASGTDFFEKIVQGLTHGIESSTNNPTTINKIEVLHKLVELPFELQQCPLYRVQVALTTEAGSGTLTWILPEETAHLLAKSNDEGETFMTSSVSGGSSLGSATDLAILYDIPLELSVELGRVSMLVQEVVDLGPGSIIEIEKAAGDPVDILVNGRFVARGEVVVIDDNFGVRVTEILNPQERISRLGEAA